MMWSLEKLNLSSNLLESHQLKVIKNYVKQLVQERKEKTKIKK
jgi:hypothetical protein